MTRLRVGTPLWLAEPSVDLDSALRFPPLRGSHTVDIAIVGGGFTGSTIAWRFADAGVRVAVLERDRIALGSTAASTALLMQEPDKDFRDLAARYGRRSAVRLWKLSQAATAECISTVKRLNISCGLIQRDSVYYALASSAAERLRREFRSRRSARLGGQWLGASELRHATGIGGAAGIRVEGNAQMNPVLACRGFVRAAVERGANFFEHSAVIHIRPARDHVEVRTKSGALRAEYVVIATGYATAEFRPLVGRFRLKSTYVAVTRPLTPRERRHLGLGRVMLWDTERPYHYARWTDDDRLLIGGADRPHARGSRRDRSRREAIAELRAYFVNLFPVLDRVSLQLTWDGLFAMTPDGLPYIGVHRKYRRHLFALGYGGNGMTVGFLAGKLLLDWYRGDNSADVKLFGFSRHRLSR